MNKKFLFLAAFVLLLISAMVFMWMKPANQLSDTDPVSQIDPQIQDWRTYRNGIAGFEIKYPIDWIVLENSRDNPDDPVISLLSPETQEMIRDQKTDYSCDLSIYYYPSVADEPENKINKFKANTLQELIERNPMIMRIGQTILGGELATDVVWGGAGAYYAILSNHADHLYRISSCSKEKRDALTKMEMVILDSFKFLK